MSESDYEIAEGAVAQPGTSTRNETGGWRVERPEFDEEKCTTCDICWEVCPDMVIERGEEVYSADLDYCKGCGICAEVCPTDAIEMEREEK